LVRVERLVTLVSAEAHPELAHISAPAVVAAALEQQEPRLLEVTAVQVEAVEQELQQEPQQAA
jgi:hypothetical protein